MLGGAGWRTEDWTSVLAMDPWLDPSFAAAELLHEELYSSFFSRAARATAGAPLTINLDALLGVLRDVGKLHRVCEVETEIFLRSQLDDVAVDDDLDDFLDKVGSGDDTPLPFERVEFLFNEVVKFQSVVHLSAEARALKFPRTNEEDAEGNTVLWNAVDAADLTYVELLLSLGSDPNRASSSGKTPLYLACERGQTELAGALMRAGADAHAAVDLMGATPFYICCHRGHIGCVDELIAFGADVNRRQRDGSSSLHVAVKINSAPLVRMLLGADADPNLRTNKGGAPLYRACATGASSEIVKALLDARADADFGDAKSGATPLHEASARGDADAARLLTAAGADADLRDHHSGNTALLRAVGVGSFSTARVLLAGHADAAKANAGGVTPLKLARLLEQRHDASTITGSVATMLAELLLDHGASYDQRSRSGRTPLYLAAQLGDVDEIEWLLRRGAAVDRRCDDGATPLQVACQEGHVDAAARLLARGACPRRVASEMDDGRHHAGAAEGGAAAYLDEREVSLLNAVPPLHLACLARDHAAAKELVQLLLAHRADPNEQDAAGFTPLRLLACRGPRELPGRAADKAEAPAVAPSRFSPQLDSEQQLQRDRASFDAQQNGLLHGEGNVEAPAAVEPPAAADAESAVEAAAAAVDAAVVSMEASGSLGAVPGGAPAALSAAAELAALLLAAGALTDVADAKGRSAAWLATHHGDEPLLRVLLERGRADPSLADRSGVQPLWAAAARGSLRVAFTLLHHGARAEQVDGHGCPAICVAAQQGEGALVRLLLSHDASPDACDANGNTSLLLASQQGHLPTARALLQAGASAATANEAGVTPLQAAFDNRYSNVRQLLQEFGADPTGLQQSRRRDFEPEMHCVTYVPRALPSAVALFMPPDPEGKAAAPLLAAKLKLDESAGEALSYTPQPRQPTPSQTWLERWATEAEKAASLEAEAAADAADGDGYDDDEFELPVLTAASLFLLVRLQGRLKKRYAGRAKPSGGVGAAQMAAQSRDAADATVAEAPPPPVGPAAAADAVGDENIYTGQLDEPHMQPEARAKQQAKAKAAAAASGTSDRKKALAERRAKMELEKAGLAMQRQAGALMLLIRLQARARGRYARRKAEAAQAAAPTLAGSAPADDAPMAPPAAVADATDEPDGSASQQKAAVAVQAAARGRAVRQQLQSGTAEEEEGDAGAAEMAASANSTAQSSEMDVGEMMAVAQHEAAITVQAVHRGRSSRRTSCEQQAPSAAPPASAEDLELTGEVDMDVAHHEAAVRMQAAARGRSVRKMRPATPQDD